MVDNNSNSSLKESFTMKHITTFIAIAIASVLALSGCDASSSQSVSTSDVVSTTADFSDSNEVIEKINSATEIRAKKKKISIGDHWDIYADGEQVGVVKGQFVYLIGDVYSLISMDGNLVASESENFKVVNSTAKIYDYNNEQTGSVRQEIFALLSKFEVIENEVVVATSQQKFSLNFTADVKDSNGEVEWKVSRDFISFGANVNITREAGDDVTGMNALWLSLVMNEVYEAAKAKEAKSDR